MNILDIKKYPDSILKKKSLEVGEIDDNTKTLIGDMIETMEKAKGLGLAAPQVGVLKRIIIVRTEKEPLPFINPKILKMSREKEKKEEGCLSLPGLRLEIKRSKWVEVEAINENKEKVQISADGLVARIFQHEIDHLNGVLFVDRLSFFQRLKFKLGL